MAHRRGSFQRSPARRRVEWGLGPGGSALVNLDSSSFSLLGAGIQATVPAMTIVRMRGLFSATLKTAAAVGDGFTGAVGVGLVTLPAFTAGILSVPTPVTEAEWDGWLWHFYFDVRSGLAGVSDGSGSVRAQADSKAMRKLQDTTTVAYAAIEVTEVGTATVDIGFDSRMLYKLP